MIKKIIIKKSTHENIQQTVFREFLGVGISKIANCIKSQRKAAFLLHSKEIRGLTQINLLIPVGHFYLDRNFERVVGADFLLISHPFQ
jgi:hypothetical protein